jgi:hypothetical protein
MRKSNVFWGVFILVIGLLLLLNTFGILPFSVWEIFWPVLLILLGLWFLLGSRLFKGRQQSGTFSLPLEGAERAQIEFHHGAGELNVSALDENSSLLIDGTYTNGLEHEITRRSGLTWLKLRPPVDGIPFGFFPHTDGYHWNLALARRLPLELQFKTGANKATLDLQNLNVSDVKLETGASETTLMLPAEASHTKVTVNSGAAAVNIRVPQGVAARIRISGGLMGVEVDQSRFPLTGESEPGRKVYQSPDYDGSAHQAESNVETGLGSINIR